MKTKEKILDKALELFNSKGLDHVSTYEIARELGLRQGNLTYHFPTKGSLINRLGKRMIEEVDEVFFDFTTPDFSIKVFYESLEKTFWVNLKYKFLYTNFARILLDDDDLKQYYIDKLESRKILMHNLFTLLAKNGYLIGGEIIKYSDSLTYSTNMMTIFWVPESLVYWSNKSEKQWVTHHLSLIFLQFRPYLTKKGEENIFPLIEN